MQNTLKGLKVLKNLGFACTLFACILIARQYVYALETENSEDIANPEANLLANQILASLPAIKRQEFIGRDWTWQDTVLNLGRSESTLIASHIGLAMAGRAIIAYTSPYLGTKSSSVLTLFGLQTLADFLSSCSREDFYLRTIANGFNLANPGKAFGFWRQALAFGFGHLGLAYHYWPEISSQLKQRYTGFRRIKFLENRINKWVYLELDASPEHDSGIELNLYFDSDRPVTMEPDNSLESTWLALVKACQERGVTLIKLLGTGKSPTLWVQLWREHKRLSETSFMVGSDRGNKQWIADVIVDKTWANETGAHQGNCGLFNPLAEPVLAVLVELVSQKQGLPAGLTGSTCQALSPKGKLAAFSTGTIGYLLADHNHTADIELPELWLNTRHPYQEGMYQEGIQQALAVLEQQQIPGKWRGTYGLLADLSRNLLVRLILLAGTRWEETDSDVELSGTAEESEGWSWSDRQKNRQSYSHSFSSGNAKKNSLLPGEKRVRFNNKPEIIIPQPHSRERVEWQATQPSFRWGSLFFRPK